MVFHLARSIPAVAALAATMMTLSVASRHELLSSIAEDNTVSLLQRHSTELANVGRHSDIANAAPSSKVVFVKTHFTGSETLTGILLRYCENHNLTCAGLCGYLRLPELRRFAEEYRGERMDIWPWHVVYDREAFHKLIPGALTVSLFREPKTRVRSGFTHPSFSAQKVWNRLHSLKKNEEIGCQSPLGEHIKKLSDMDMVLITEDYDRGLVLLAKKLGWPLQEMMYLRVHETTDLTPDHLQAVDEFFAYVEQPSENLTEAARAWKHGCLEVDGLLYNAAKKTYHEQLRHLTREERDEVERHTTHLQMANEALADCCTKDPLDLACEVLGENGRHWNMRVHHDMPPADHGHMTACHKKALEKLER